MLNIETIEKEESDIMGKLKDIHKKHPSIERREKHLDFSRAKTMKERRDVLNREAIRKRSLGLLRR